MQTSDNLPGTPATPSSPEQQQQVDLQAVFAAMFESQFGMKPEDVKQALGQTTQVAQQQNLLLLQAKLGLEPAKLNEALSAAKEFVANQPPNTAAFYDTPEGLEWLLTQGPLNHYTKAAPLPETTTQTVVLPNQEQEISWDKVDPIALLRMSDSDFYKIAPELGKYLESLQERHKAGRPIPAHWKPFMVHSSLLKIPDSLKGGLRPK